MLSSFTGAGCTESHTRPGEDVLGEDAAAQSGADRAAPRATSSGAGAGAGAGADADADAMVAFYADAGPPDAGPMWQSCDSGEANVVGTTPAGGFEGTHAFLYEFGGECAGWAILISPQPLDFDTPHFYTVRPPAYLDFRLQWDSSYPIEAHLVANGMESTTLKGTLEVSGASVEGELAVGSVAFKADGWDLSGSFSAPLCDRLRIDCP